MKSRVKRCNKLINNCTNRVFSKIERNILLWCLQFNFCVISLQNIVEIQKLQMLYYSIRCNSDEDIPPTDEVSLKNASQRSLPMPLRRRGTVQNSKDKSMNEQGKNIHV